VPVVTLRGLTKLVSALGVAVLLATLAACGSSGSNKADAPAADNTTAATPTTHKAPAKKANKSTAAKKHKTASATTTVPKGRLGFGSGTTVPGAVVVPAIATGSQVTLPAGVGVGSSGEKNNGNPSSPGTTVKPYDPGDGIDLSGTPGVTAAQQHAAEQLLRDSLRDLPHWASQATAYAEGFRTIGDAITGDEHMINWAFAQDDTVLDSKKPEALVYKIRPGQAPLLEAAMYLLKPTDRFANIPPLFQSPLTQFHVHTNLCFVQTNTNDGVQQFVVAGLTDGNGNCRPGQIKFPPVPMIHAWIVANPCGPFSALEGVGAGQTEDGSPANCDTAHAGVL
jgi:hypothetical protein